MRTTLATFLLGLSMLGPLHAQGDVAGGVDGSRSGQGELVYPRDEDRIIARVDGRDLLFGDLVRHLDARHSPGFGRYLATPAGNLYFRAPYRFGADWVRQFADMTALKAEARARELDPANAERFLSGALESSFEAHLEREQKRGSLGKDLTQELINIRLSKYQQEYGLQTEVQGWLDFLVPEDSSDEALLDYFRGHARVFGGKVTFAHVLIHDRDKVTLRRLDGAERARAWEKVADIRARLKKDGSNFEDVAARYSEDRRTADRGGVFRHVSRFDPRLPAVLCRTAWKLRDGEFTGPVVSPYGLHFVKRISYVQHEFLVFIPKTKPMIAETMRKHRQEDLLFRLREKLRVELRY
jgi:hypothetical protein